MNCDNAFPLLNPLCDNALEPRDAALVVAHLETCASCQAEWHELEMLRTIFQEEKRNVEIPPGLMSGVHTILDREVRAQARQSKNIYLGRFSIITLVASFAAIALIVCISTSRFGNDVGVVANANVLVDQVRTSAARQQVVSKDNLPGQIGYRLKYLNLPDWKLMQSSVWKQSSTALARFDFAGINSFSNAHLSCYQGLKGSIRLSNLDRGVIAAQKIVNGKSIVFGTRGEFNYALWSQNGRDYLFVTDLPQDKLETIVSAT